MPSCSAVSVLPPGRPASNFSIPIHLSQVSSGIRARRSRGVCVCEQLHDGETPPSPPHDARIRAAVIADSPSEVFTQDNLVAIKIPLQFWRSELGGGGVEPSGTERLASSLPGKPDVHVIPAGHYGFLPPRSPQLAANLPRFCTDPPDFDLLYRPSTTALNTRRTSAWVSLTRACSEEKSGASPARAITRSSPSPAASGLKRPVTHSRRICVRSL
jgi:hypothetical protein